MIKTPYKWMVLVVLVLIGLGLQAHNAQAAGCTGTGNCYWVGGTGAWSGTTHWATASGGATTGGLPGAGDNVIFDSNSNATAYTVTVDTSATALDVNVASSAAGKITLAGSSALAVSGNLDMISGSTGITNSYTGAITFNATSGTKTITSNGVSFGSPFIFNGVGGTWQLGDNFTTTGSLTLTNGTFDAGNHNATISSLSSSNNNIRTLTMGSGTWTLTGNNATIWNIANPGNMTQNTSTNPIICNYSGSTGTRTIEAGLVSLATNTPYSFSITAGSDTVSVFNGYVVGNFDFTGFTGTLANSGFFASGNLTFSSGMTLTAGTNAIQLLNVNAFVSPKTITTNGKTLDFPVTELNSAGFSTGSPTFQLADNLTLGSTRALTLTSGTFNANNKNVTAGSFSSSNSNARTLTMGSGTWTLVGTGTVWDSSTATGLTLTPGTSTIVVNDTSSTGKTFSGGSATFNNIQFTGAGTGAYTIAGSNTFGGFTVSTPPDTVDFTGGTTNTACTWNLSGTAGNANTITSTNTTAFTLATNSNCGSPTLDHLTLSYATLSPAGYWIEGNSFTDGGNNSDLTAAVGTATHPGYSSSTATPTPSVSSTPIPGATASPTPSASITPTPSPSLTPSSTLPVTLIKYPGDPKVYVVENGTKRWIKSADDFNRLGYRWGDIQIVPSSQTYPDGTAIGAATVFISFLTRGSSSAEVQALQQKLKDLGFFPANVATTIYFGPTTVAAVKAFQKAHGIQAVGYVGPATRAALNQ